MAYACLYETPAPDWAEAGSRWFFVQSWPFTAEPFDGPPQRDWHRFVVIDEHKAEFAWRSTADRIRDIAQQVDSGELGLDAALADHEFGEYMDRQVELWSEADEEPAELDRIIAAIVDEIVTDLADPASESPIGYYCTDGDLHLQHAAEALGALPPWARRRYVDAGGPGTGYEAAVLVLDAGYGLHDLARHLCNGEAA